MKPLYIVGTQRDVGKTTLALGLLHAFRQRGMKVAYTKPLGQRITTENGHVLHDDARVVAHFLELGDENGVEMAIPLPAGRVEKEIKDLHTDLLLKKVVDACAALASTHDAVIVEAMGHVAMGSCLGLSTAEVAKGIGARALLVSGGGIGRAIDEISLCQTFLKARGADMMGVVVNKVFQDKYARIKEATTRGLAILGTRSYGTVPFEESLVCPTMKQVHAHLGGELLGGRQHMVHRVHRTIVAAMEADNMIRYITEGTLVITPGDRSDNILAALSMHMIGETEGPLISGMILTGGIRPGEMVLRLIKDSHLSVLLVEEDTYSVASKLRQTTFKMTPEDKERFNWAVCVIAEYVDIDGILKALEA